MTALIRSHSILQLLVLSGCLAVGTSTARAQAETNIGVRTEVVDGFLHPTDKQAADGGHSKLYGVLSVDPIPGEYKLVKPLDANQLLAILHRELAANGFKKVARGSKPDILLTVSYGRGYMRNPYVSGTGAMATSVDSTPTQTITGADVGQLFNEVKPSYQAKIAKAQYEKLFIRVTAFEFPKTKDAKTKMLWKTVIVADDPDNRDLNSLAAAMLAAGAPLFDKETKDKEIDLYKPLMNGRVEVGTPEVVEPAPAPAKK